METKESSSIKAVFKMLSEVLHGQQKVNENAYEWMMELQARIERLEEECRSKSLPN